jgi:hypothetical protein
VPQLFDELKVERHTGAGVDTEDHLQY